MGVNLVREGVVVGGGVIVPQIVCLIRLCDNLLGFVLLSLQEKTNNNCIALWECSMDLRNRKFTEIEIDKMNCLPKNQIKPVLPTI